MAGADGTGVRGEPWLIGAVCAVAYLILRERAERRADSAILAAMVSVGVARAMGSDQPMPDGPSLVDDALERFDTMLVAPPEVVTADPDTYVLLQALGLREV